MRTWANIFWLGTKELRSLFSDAILVGFMIWAFTFAIYLEAKEVGETVNNASIAFVDEDHSALSRHLTNALYPPYFKTADLIEAKDVDRSMDQSRHMFVVVIPPRFEADVRQGRKPKLQINIDATAVMQAALGAGYIEQTLLTEVARFASRSEGAVELPMGIVTRRAFNPNGMQSWFASIVALLNQISLLTIVLTGAALLREREHGTIEHLLVMPLTSFQIAMAKVWANGLVVLFGFTLSLAFVVQQGLDVPIAGSKVLLLAGTAVYLLAAAAIGIFLGTVARTMAQFSLLMLMTIIPIMMLSGGMSPIESQPEIIRPITWLLPSRHYMAFAQAVAFRGAGFDIVWPDFVTVTGLGMAFFAASLILFRRSIATAK
jgi:ABC-2 type transport system permease protein